MNVLKSGLGKLFSTFTSVVLLVSATNVMAEEPVQDSIQYTIKLSPGNYVYNGKEQKPGVEVKELKTDSVIPDSEYVVSYKNNVDAGTAIVMVSDSAGGKYKLANQTASYKINPITASLSLPTEELTYSGTKQGVAVSITNIQENDIVNISYEGDSAIAAGSYKAKITSLSNQNYALSDSDSTFVWAISPKQLESGGFIVEIGNSPFVYNGKAQIPSVTIKDGAIVVTDSEYIVVCKKDTAAGMASLVIRDSVGGNYTIADTSLTYEIEPLPVELEWSTVSFEYDGTPKGVSAKITNTVGDDVVSISGYENDSAVVVGKYTAKITGLSNGNYKIGASDSTIVWTINSSKITISLATDSTYIYNGKAQEPEVVVMVGADTVKSDEYVVTYKNNIDAGTAKIVVTDTVSGNYSLVTDSLDFTIEPKEVTLSWPTDRFIYDGAAHSISATIGNVIETDTVAVSSYTDTTKTKIGTYTAVANSLDNQNYKLPADASHEWSIDPIEAKISISFVEPDSVYIFNGSEQTAPVTVTVGGKELAASDYQLAYVNNTNAGTASIVIKDSVGSCYTFADTTITFEIKPETIKLEWTTSNFTYDGSKKGIAATVKDAIGSEDVEVSGYTGDSATTAGNYIAKVSGLTNSNYMLAPADSTHEWSIVPAEGSITINLPKDTTYTYNGLAQKPVVVVTMDNDTIPADEYNVAYNDSVNAGTAIIVVTDKEKGNYTFDAADTSFIINPIVAEISWSATSFEYDGTKKGVSASISNELKTGDVEIIGYEGDSATAVGSYTVKITGLSNNNYKLASTDSTYKWSIVSIEGSITINLPKDTVYTYNGLAQKPVVVVTMGKDTIPEDEYTVSYKDCVNAGEATITVTDKAGGDYTFEAADSSFIIKPKVVELKWTDDVFTYKEGTKQGISATVNGVIGEDSVAISGYEGDSAVNVGEYTAKVIALSSENYAITDSTHIWTINPITGSATIEFNKDSIYTYNGKAQEPVVVAKIDDHVIPSVEYETLYEDNVKADTSTIKVVAKENGNYKFDVVSATFVIHPITAKISWSEAELSYNGEKQGVSATIDNVISGDEVAINGYENDSAVAVGSYTARITGVSNSNYTIAAGDSTQEWSIAPATGVISVLFSDSTYNYNGKKQNPVVTVKMSETSLSSDDYVVSCKDNTNAGIATVTISAADGGNYKFDAVDTSFIIEPLVAELSWSDKNLTYDGTRHGVSATISNKIGTEDVEISGYENDSAIAVGSYTAKITGISNSNYKIATGDSTLVWSIEAAEGSISVNLPRDTTYTYNGKEQTPTVEVVMNGEVISESEYTVAYDNNILAGTAAITVTDNDGGNYSFEKLDTSFVIVPMTAALLWTDDVFTYDGDKHGVSASVTNALEGDEVEVSKYTQDSAQSVGSYVAKAVELSNSNYQLSIDASHTWQIKSNLGDVVVSLAQDSLTYNGEEQTPAIVVTVNGDTVDASEYEVTYSNNKNAGTATVNIADVDGGNYEMEPTSKSFVILPKQVILEWSKGEFTYDGAKHGVSAAITNVLEGDAVEISAYRNDSAVTASNYVASVVGLTNSNYSLGSSDSTMVWSIVAKEGSVSLNFTKDTTYTYNGKAYEPGVEFLMDGKVIPSADYKVSYTDNVKAGTASVIIADVDGGNYKFDSTSKNFIINPLDVQIEWTKGVFTYNGKKQGISATISNVVEGDDVEIVGYTGDSATAVGFYNAKISGITNANYRLAVDDSSRAWRIKELTGDYTLTLSDSVFTYDGNAQTPSVALMMGEITVPATEYTVSYANNTSAGTAQVFIADVAGGNFQIDSSSVSFVILPKKVDILWTEGKFVYDGSVKGVSATITNAVSGDVVEIIGYIADSASSVGDYTAKIVGLSNANYSLASDDSTKTWTIKEQLAEPTIVFEDSIFIYNGKAQTASLMVKVGETTLLESEYEVTYADNTNAGVATVTVFGKDGGNYKLDTVSSTFVIKPLDVKLSWSEGDFTYNTMRQGISASISNVVEGDNVGFIGFRGDSAINAGSYTAQIIGLNNSNYHLASEDSTKTWQIRALTGNSTIALSDSSFVYDSKAQMPSVVLTMDDMVVPASEYTITYQSNINAGSAQVIIADVEGGNFQFDSSSVSFEILPKQAIIEWNDSVFVYDGTKKGVSATVSNVVGDDEVSIEGYTGDSATIVGSYTAKISGLSNANYKLADSDSIKNWSIKELVVDPSIVLEDSTFIYNGKQQYPTVIVKAGDNLIPNEEYAITYSNNKNAGVATITVTDKEGGNYNVATDSATFVINPLDVQLDWSRDSFSYDGTAKGISVAISNALENDDVDVSGYFGDSAVMAGSYVARVNGLTNQNYRLRETDSTKEWIINPLTGDYSIALLDSSFSYDGSSKTPSVVLMMGDMAIPSNEYEVSYSNNTDAGIAKVSVKDKDGGNFNLETKTDSFSIHPISIKLVSASHTWSYDGVEHQDSSVSVVEGAFVGEQGFSYTVSGKITNVGSTENTFNFEALSNTKLGNYKVEKTYGVLTVKASTIVPEEQEKDTVVIDPISGDTVEISPASSTGYTIVLANTDSLVYNGKSYEPEVAVYVNGTKIDTAEYSVSYANNTNAGTATVTITDKAGGNYELVSKVDSFSIAPVALTFVSASHTWNYDGDEHQDTSVVLKDGSFVGDDKFTCLVTGKIADVGVTDNSFNCIELGNTNAANYSIEKIYGVLTVKEITIVPTDETKDTVVVSPSTGDTIYIGPISSDTTIVDPSTGDTIEFNPIIPGAGYTIAINSGDSLFYNGKAQEPMVAVYVNGVLVDTSEYMLTYSNNKDAGTAMVTVSDREGGNYNLVSRTDSFTIYPMAITLQSPTRTWTYDGIEHQTATVKVAKGSFPGSEGVYTIVTGAIKNVGSVENKFVYSFNEYTKESNYIITTVYGVLTVNAISVIPESQDSMVVDPVTGDTTHYDPATGEPIVTYSLEVNPNKDSIVYNGKPQEPEVVVYVGGEKLDSAEYEVIYKNNTEAGTATVTVKSRDGANYELRGTSSEFTISQKPLVVEFADTSYIYDGKQKKLRITLDGVADGDTVKVIVKGDTATSAGVYTAKVSGVDNKNYVVDSAEADWAIEKAVYKMPELSPIAETVAGNNDGHIDGLVEGMQIKREGDSVYTKVTNTDVDLMPGTYLVRMPETDNYKESELVRVIIEAGAASFEIDSIIVKDFGYCPETEDAISYYVNGDGQPTEYRIIYSESAEKVGFESTDFTDIEEDGILPITIPNCDADTFKAQIQFRANGVESRLYDIEIKVNLSTKYMVDKWSDVISAVNVENRFEKYQWFHNDEKLDGETKPFYCEKNGLTGSYYMEVLTVDNRNLRTCKLYFGEPKIDISLTAYPNPVTDYTTIELNYDDGSEHNLKVYNTKGNVVQSTTFLGNKIVVNLSNLSAATYVVKVDGVEVKVIKK